MIIVKYIVRITTNHIILGTKFLLSVFATKKLDSAKCLFVLAPVMVGVVYKPVLEIVDVIALNLIPCAVAGANNMAFFI